MFDFPDTKSPEFQSLQNEFGENKSILAFIRNGHQTPDLSLAKDLLYSQKPKQDDVKLISESDEGTTTNEDWNTSGLANKPVQTSSKHTRNNIPTASSGRRVSSGYGYRKDPFTGKREFHDGIDIPVPMDTPLKPFGEGTVVFAGTRKGYGKSVGIDYGNGVTVYVNHLNSTKVEPGDKVKPEAIIGYSGSSGRSTGPHVHIQAMRDGKSIDPSGLFTTNPKQTGLDLVLRDLTSNSSSITTNPYSDWNTSDLANAPSKTNTEGWDTSGLLDSSTQDSQQTAETPPADVDSDVIKYEAPEKEQAENPLATSLRNSDLAKAAIGWGRLGSFKPQMRVQNPNPPGKPISFIIKTQNGKPPTDYDVAQGVIQHLGLQNIAEKYLKDPEISKIVGSDKSIISFPYGTPSKSYTWPSNKYTKNPDGSYTVTAPGLSKGIVDTINAYARGGASAWIAKKQEIQNQSAIYNEDIENQKTAYKQVQQFYENHPYVAAIRDTVNGRAPTPVIHGIQEASLGELQFGHTMEMLPQAWEISTIHGFDSKEYSDLIKQDIKTQSAILEAQASIPEENTLIGSVAKGLTSSIIGLPRYIMAGQLGAPALPTMVFLENLHRGEKDAILAALPMAAMGGTGHALEEFMSSGGNPLDFFKQSSIANRDIIASISEYAPGNQAYLFAPEQAKFIDFKSVTPFQRQLIMRGSNAAVLAGSDVALSPNRSLQQTVSQAIIGFGLPVGRSGELKLGEFRRPSIISGDAYTLADGSVLLHAPIYEPADLIMGRVPREGGVRTYNPIEDLTFKPRGYLPPAQTIENRPITLGGAYQEGHNIGEVGGNVVSPPFRWGERRVAITQEPRVKLLATIQDVEGAKNSGKAVMLDLNTAALNLLDLRKALANNDFLPTESSSKVFDKAFVEAQRRSDLQKAIDVLDKAIPQETQRFYEQHEEQIRAAIKSNYESNMAKEDFIKGRKELRKSNPTIQDVEEFNPRKTSSTDTLLQKTRRSLVTVEESGRKGLERNKKNKGTFNAGLDPSDIPYLVQIVIGKMGRKGLDAAETIKEMVAEHGEDFLKYGKEVIKQANDYIQGVNMLSDALDNRFIADKGTLKTPPFPIAEQQTIKNIFYIGSKYLRQAEEQDIPIDKIVATQKGVRTRDLIKFGEDPNQAILAGRTDLVGNIEVPKAVKINDQYFLFDGHHRSSTAKIKGEDSIKGRVIDFNKIANGDISARSERAKEAYGETGSKNQYFTQEKQLEVRENLFKAPDTNELQEGLTGSAKWFAQQSSNLVQLVGFHVEDAYRRGIEPKIEDIISKLKDELGDWIDKIDVGKWQDIFEKAKTFYQTNNADPFFSKFKQNVLERFPNGNMNAKSARNFINGLGTKNEIEWTAGLNEYLDNTERNGEKVSKDKLLEIINQGQVRVNEVELGNLLTNQERYRLDELKTKELGSDLTAEEGIEYQRLINKANNSKTQYDLNSYRAEKLELEGYHPGTSKEVLLQVPVTRDKLEAQIKYEQELINKYNTDFNTLYSNNSPITAEEHIKLVDLKDANHQQVADSIYKSSHWNQENIVAHFRANERTVYDDASAKSNPQEGFHIEEIQSDWNREGRKKGYRLTEEERQQKAKELNEKINNIEQKSIQDLGQVAFTPELIRLRSERASLIAYDINHRVPQNPFMENNWKELAFKRALRMAIDKGKDILTWTTAKQQRERYNKTLEGKSVAVQKYGINNYDLYVSIKSPMGDRAELVESGITKNRIAELTNEDIANKLESHDNLTYFDLDKSIDFSKGYSDYDTYFVNLAKKIGKRFGAEYKLKEIPTSSAETYSHYDKDGNRLITLTTREASNRYANENPNVHRVEINNEGQDKIEQVHSLEITLEMRESLQKEGQPLFGLSEKEPLKPSQPIGIRNRIITTDAFDSAKDEIVKSLSDFRDSHGTIFNSGLNPDAFLDQIKILYKGWNDFKTFSKDLVNRFGDAISPHLESIWNWVKETANEFNADEVGAWAGLNPFAKKSTIPHEGRSTQNKIIDAIDQTHRGIYLAEQYPEFGKMYDTIGRVRRIANSYGTTTLAQLSKGIKLLQNDTNNIVAQAIFARNEEGVKDSQEDARIIARFGLDAKEEQAYNHIRAAVGNVLEIRKAQLLYRYHQKIDNIHKRLADKGWPSSGKPINPQHEELLTRLVDISDNIKDINEYYDKLKNSGYISLQRIGKIAARAENTSYLQGDPRRVLVDFADSIDAARDRIKDWENQYGANNIANARTADVSNPKTFADVAGTLTPSKFEDLVAASGVNSKSADIDKLRTEVYEKYPSMGYQLKREFYEGYKRTNEFMIKSIAHQADVYQSSYYNNTARNEGLKAIEASGLKTSNPSIYELGINYINDETSTSKSSIITKTAMTGRRIAFAYQMYYSIKQLYLHLIARPIVQNYNYLARVENPLTGDRLGGIKEVEQFFINGTRLATKIGREGLGLNVKHDAIYDEFSDTYNRLKQEEVVTPQFTKSLLQLDAEKPVGIDNKYKSLTRRFFSIKQQEHWASSFLRAGDTGSRTQMAASMFLIGKKFGLSGEALHDFIIRGIEATNGNYSRGENPNLIRKAGEVGKLFYQFSVFRHSWLENLALNVKSDWKHRSIAATARTLGPMLITSGIRGLPLSGFAFALYALSTGRNPVKDAKKEVSKLLGDNEYLENAVLNGWTGRIGLSHGVKFPILDNAADALTQDSYFDKLLSSDIPAVATTKQIASGLSDIAQGIYKWQHTGKLINKKKLLIEKGAEQLLPQFARQPIRAAETASHGYTTPKGVKILSKKKVSLTDEVLQSALGVTPNKVTEKYEADKYKKIRKSKLGKATKKLIRKVL